MRSQKDIDTIKHWQDFHLEIRAILGVKYNTVECTRERAAEIVGAVRELIESFEGIPPENIESGLYERLEEISGLTASR